MKAIYAVIVNGRDISSTLAPILHSLDVTDKAGSSSDTASIEIDDTDGAVIMPNKGASITITLGWEGGPIAEVFKGKVDEVRSQGSRGAGRTLRISAKGVDENGKAKQPQNRHMDNKSLKDALTDAGKEAGITSIKVDPDLAKVTRDYWSLDAESFLHFGERVAREVGGTFKVRDGEAVMAKKAGGKSAGGQTMPTITAAWGDNLMSWEIAPILGRPQFKQVRGRYYDRKEGKWKSVEVEIPGTEATAKLTRRTVSADEDEAKGGAENDKTESEKNKGGGSVSIDGNAQARPEGKCIVAGARPGIDGTYTIESVTHTVSRSGGWVTKLDLKKPEEGAGKDSRKPSASGKPATPAPGTAAATPAASPSLPSGTSPGFAPPPARQ